MGLLLRFNVIAMTVFLIVMVIAEFMALRDIRARVHADREMTSALADYLIESQTSHLQFDFKNYGIIPTEKAVNRLFDLERLHYLKHLNIQFISPSGQLVDSNKTDESSLPKAMPDWIMRFLTDYLYEKPVIKPVLLAGQTLGAIHISHDVNSEINEIWVTSKEMILPLLLVFLAGSLLIALLASLIVKPAEKLLQVSRQLSGTIPVQRRFFGGMSDLLDARHQLKGIGRQLQDYNRQLRDLNDKMLTMHENERKRLSAELHDEIGQHLTAIRFDTATIDSAIDLAEAKQAGQSINKINQKLTDIIRSILHRLRPALLDIAGLEASLRELVDEWQQRHPQHFLKLQIEGDLLTLEDTTKLTIYRAVQEALTNIARHAGDVVNVVIHLQEKPQQLLLTISDDGRGCDLQKTTPGFGLLAMRERVEALSGEFTVSSSPGDGLTVVLSIPV
ncbi:MAG: sensor histidine kinase [Methylophaga sp.]|nr:sensor histidine kinase [Methylophaga sp.]